MRTPVGTGSCPVGVVILAPVDRVLVADHAERVLGLRLAFVELAAVLLDHRVGVGHRDHAFGDQLLGVDLARRRVLADLLVHHRLRRRRLVGFVVAEAAIADQVDDHVLVERHAVVEREARDEQHRFRVVAVHVEDRRLDASSRRRVQYSVERASRGSEIVKPTWLLMMMCTRAAGVEAARLRHLQRLHHHALARERGVAVDQDRHDLVALARRRGAAGARAPSLRPPG